MGRKPTRKAKHRAVAKKPQQPKNAEQLESEIARRLQTGTPDKAIGLCEELLSLRPGEQSHGLWRETLFESIEHALDLGRWNHALRQIEKAAGAEQQDSQRLEILHARARAGLGQWDSLFSELGQSSTDQGRLRAIEEAIRRELVDLELLAETDLLSCEHPLRIAAGKLALAFRQVTSGPVGSLDLPELSRRSPLAGWLMLVQAIASFHAGTDELCQRLLRAIPKGSAAERGGAILAAALKGASTPALASRLCGGGPALRAAAAAVDRALQGEITEKKFYPLAREAVQLAEALDPQKLPQLRQRLFVQLSLKDIMSSRLAGLIQPFEARSSFWRDWATVYQAHEQGQPLAAAAWEEYRQHALAEGHLSPIQESALLIRIASLIDPDPLERNEMLEDCLELLNWAYRSQPRPIRSISVIGSGSKPPAGYLDPKRCFQRACALDPHAQTFESWLNWERAREGGNPDGAAEAWHKSHPGDLAPLLALIASKEAKGASAQAQSLLGKALQLDRLNPELLLIEMRLAVANCKRLLKTGKLHLVNPPLRTLEGAELMKRGKRSAVLAGLHCILFDQQRKADLAQRAFQAVIERMGNRTMAMLLVGSLADSRANELFKALGQNWKLASGDLSAIPVLSRLLRDFRLSVRVPANWPKEWLKQVGKIAPQMDPDDLCELCDFAATANYRELAYACSGGGLRREGIPKARFLMHRARSLPDWYSDRFEDCLTVAHRLACSEGDTITRGEIVELARSAEFDLRELEFDDAAAERILQAERKAKVYPKAGDGLCNCPACLAKRGGRGRGRDGLGGFGLDLLGDLLGDLGVDEFDDLERAMRDMPPELLEAMMKEMLNKLEPRRGRGKAGK